MRRRAALLICALIATRARAEPPAAEERPASRRDKIIAAATIGGIHLAYATWSYFAWYRGADVDDFHLEHTKWFDDKEYSGSADKLGHAWSNYTLTRGTTAVLVAGGWNRFHSSLVAAGLTEVAFTLTELEDGFVFGFDWKDMVSNVSGAALGVLMENVPEVDRLLDFRVAYFPSRDFRRAVRKMNSVDVGQDYSGQTYLLALHLGALPHALDTRWTSWSRFVDLSFGFETRNYSPAPMPRVDPREQTVFLGVSLNMQGVLRAVFPCDTTGRRIGIGAAEVLQIPYTTLPLLSHSRYPDL
jgi:hypothetical protein